MLCALTGDIWWWHYKSGPGSADCGFAYTIFSEVLQAVCPGSKESQNEGGNNRWAQSSKFGTGGVGVPRLTQTWACHSLGVRALWKVAELLNKGLVRLTIWWQTMWQLSSLEKRRQWDFPGLPDVQGCTRCLYTEGFWQFITEAQCPGLSWGPFELHSGNIFYWLPS